MKISVRDRAAIERLYPPDVFAHDAGINSDAKAAVRHGVRIVSAVDSDGEFTLERASRHVGETPAGPDDATFLSPFLGSTADAPARNDGYGGPEERRIGDRKTDDYSDFIDHIIIEATAKRVPAQPRPGDERLRGPRQ
jgi:hypothetical protein